MKHLLVLFKLLIALPLLAEADPFPEPARRDPFAFQAPQAGNDGLVAAPAAAIPPGIRVLGILVLGDRPPLAVLSLPGKEHPVYVREDDVIQIDPPAAARTSPSTAASGDPRQMYLLVRRVTAQEVELAPRTRPEDVRIYR